MQKKKKEAFKPKDNISKSKTVSSKESEKKELKVLESLRGMKDILPREGKEWSQVYRKAMDIAEAYGFQYMETPVVEPSSLFIRSIGRGTDVVDKEMYVFEDKDGMRVCLRPEFTASFARSYIQHGMLNLPQPVKVWTWGQLFRHDRPQAGRYRQFHQFDCETFGEFDPVIDAELISVAYNFLRDLGIETTVHINSIGSLEDRQNYTMELVVYLKTKRSYLCEDCKKRLVKNPLRVLDCKQEGCKIVVQDAPQIIDWLSPKSKNFFMSVIEYLDEMKVEYTLDSTLVRGLDYYSDTVFEIFANTGEEGSQSALGGGGRYDSLIEQLGGRPTPACGFALGMERVIHALAKAKQLESTQIVGQGSLVTRIPKMFFAQLGEQARRRSLLLIEDLRRKGVTVDFNLAKSSLKAQLEIADKIGATHTVIIGQKEVQDDTAIIRDMDSGIQETIDQKKLYQEIIKKLKKNEK